MDELLRFADAFDLLSGVSDLDLVDEGSIDALSQILEGADYFSSAPDLLEAFSHLNLEEMDMWNESSTDFFENLSGVEQGEFLSGLDAEPLEITTSFSLDAFDPGELENLDFASTFMDAQEVQERLSGALLSIPEPFQANLGSIDWTPSYHPIEGPKCLGVWRQYTDGRFPDIKLFDHAEQAESVFYHEMGHHIASIQPDFFAEFRDISLTEPELWNYEASHLSSYSDIQDWDDELFAQSIKQYQTQPEILQDLAPRTYEVIHKRWQAAMSAQTA